MTALRSTGRRTQSFEIRVHEGAIGSIL